MSIIRVFVGIAAATAAAYGVYKLAIEKIDKQATVKTKEVKTEAKVERYEEVEGSGWKVPDGAFDVHSRQEVKTYSYVNGYSIPQYDTKYTYKVKRWVYNRTVATNGESIDVDSLNLKKSENGTEVGDERLTTPVTSYSVTAASCETGEFLKIPVTKDIYSTVHVGDILNFKVRRIAPKHYTSLGMAVYDGPVDKTDDISADSDAIDEKLPDGDNSDNANE